MQLCRSSFHSLFTRQHPVECAAWPHHTCGWCCRLVANIIQQHSNPWCPDRLHLRKHLSSRMDFCSHTTHHAPICSQTHQKRPPLFRQQTSRWADELFPKRKCVQKQWDPSMEAPLIIACRINMPKSLPQNVHALRNRKQRRSNLWPPNLNHLRCTRTQMVLTNVQTFVTACMSITAWPLPTDTQTTQNQQ